ncbi:glycogenin-1 isoform X2 [Drosophila novamexicana]|uniref:glycogenin-1 isoform X2 n=1 Tax=Drosophila novamexicana TaxID=47314 RepID=UPI0011E60551|nr:glycogenin-1 isoform X2 [Drosophila novamexicana]
MSKFAWVTLTTNDTYSLGALVLAHSLKRAGTAHQLAVLVTPTVSEAMRDRLKDVYNVVQEVNVLDSQDAANLALLARPELGVTFTKLHCWRLVQFEKCVFLDADTLVLKNCDELFEREELSAAPDVSWPDCFNSGVFVFKPSVETFNQITEFAVKNGSFDGGDQGLLNQFFADWATADIKKHLPFVYNVTAYASYCYLPAFKQFRDKIKILHFAGKLKPWLIQFNSETKTAATPHDYSHAQDLIQHWWTIFCDNVHHFLDNTMPIKPDNTDIASDNTDRSVQPEAGLAGALAQLRIGVERTPEQEQYENLMRRQCWESGQIDYSGADAFDNIWKKITQTLEAKPEKEGDAEADQTDNDNDNDNTIGYNKMLTKTASRLLQQTHNATPAWPRPSSDPSPSPSSSSSLATNQGSSVAEATASPAAATTNQLPTNAQKTVSGNTAVEQQPTTTTGKPQRVQPAVQATQPQHILQQNPAPTKPSRQKASRKFK